MFIDRLSEERFPTDRPQRALHNTSAWGTEDSESGAVVCLEQCGDSVEGNAADNQVGEGGGRDAKADPAPPGDSLDGVARSWDVEHRPSP